LIFFIVNQFLANLTNYGFWINFGDFDQVWFLDIFGFLVKKLVFLWILVDFKKKKKFDIFSPI